MIQKDVAFVTKKEKVDEIGGREEQQQPRKRLEWKRDHSPEIPRTLQDLTFHR